MLKRYLSGFLLALILLTSSGIVHAAETTNSTTWSVASAMKKIIDTIMCITIYEPVDS